MAVYLYNLLFSLTGSDVTLGRFAPFNTTTPNPTVLNQSCAWFTYQPQGTPSNLGDYFTPVASPVTPASWANPQSDANSLSLNPGDFLMMRLASLDGNAGTYRARFTAIFGRGTGSAPGAVLYDLQSPLQMNTPSAQSTLPRAVIDVDGTMGANWPTPILSDNSWLNWLGAAHAPPNSVAVDYSVNAGASVLAGGNYYTFGRDPRMHVGGGNMKIKPGDCAA
ncbi:MAG: hypothetical protein ACRD3L_00060 [Terriglobales bacterium]